MGASLGVAGTGVGLREKGLEEGVSVPLGAVDVVVVSVELCRLFVRAKLLRRKGRGGIR